MRRSNSTLWWWATASRPLVVICARQDRLFPEVESAVREQYADYAVHFDDPFPSRSYPDFIRAAWAGLGDLVIIEGDVLPPPGAIATLLACPGEWCQHELWLGDHFVDINLGLVKFSQRLQQHYPRLPDDALTRQSPRPYGWRKDPAWLEPNKHLGVVPIDKSVLRVWPEMGPQAAERASLPGSTCDPRGIDIRLYYGLTVRGARRHMHNPPPDHLRYPPVPGVGPRWPDARLPYPLFTVTDPLPGRAIPS